MGFNWKDFIDRYSSFNTPGHFYCPIPDFDQIQNESGLEFTNPLKIEHKGIDFNEETQLHFVNEFLNIEKDFPNYREKHDLCYKIDQRMYPLGDAFTLFAMMRHYKPKKIIEIGSGFSSGVMIDYCNIFKADINLTFIEPYPERLLPLLGDAANYTLHDTNLQEVELSTFESLSANDILFIDSSHISRHGSDVNYILFDILPSIKPGVIVHFHDIFASFDYPKAWYAEGRAWNEAFILKAFLQYNSDFKMLFFHHYMQLKYPELCKRLNYLTGGGSLWLKKNEK